MQTGKKTGLGNSYTGVRPISGSHPLRSAEERLRGGWRLRLELNLLSLPISDIAELIDTLRSHRFVTAPEGIEIDGNICGSSAKHDKDQNRHQYSLYIAIHSRRLSWWNPHPDRVIVPLRPVRAPMVFRA